MGYRGCTNCGKTMRDDGSECPSCGLTTGQFAARASDARFLCTTCGATVNSATTVTKGSFLIEVVLWLMMILPGLLYSIWRLTSRFKACPNCKNPTLIPIDSPVARATIERLR